MVREKTDHTVMNEGPGAGGRTAAADRRPLTDQGKLVYKEKKRWGFLGLPFTFTTYLLYENDIQIKSGFLSSVENDCYMYRVIDVQLRISFLQRLFGLGTVICSEEAKIRRRTVNMQNIGAFEDLDGDGMPD